MNITKSWKINRNAKVMLGNVKIKEISNFGKLINSEKILCYQKPLMLLKKWTAIGKIYFAKLFILYYGASMWIQSNLLGSFWEDLL